MGPLSKISIKWGFAFKVCADKRIADRMSFDFETSMDPANRFNQSWNSLLALKVAGDSSRQAIVLLLIFDQFNLYTCLKYDKGNLSAGVYPVWYRSRKGNEYPSTPINGSFSVRGPRRRQGPARYRITSIARPNGKPRHSFRPDLTFRNSDDPADFFPKQGGLDPSHKNMINRRPGHGPAHCFLQFSGDSSLGNPFKNHNGVQFSWNRFIRMENAVN